MTLSLCPSSPRPRPPNILPREKLGDPNTPRVSRRCSDGRSGDRPPGGPLLFSHPLRLRSVGPRSTLGGGGGSSACSTSWPGDTPQSETGTTRSHCQDLLPHSAPPSLPASRACFHGNSPLLPQGTTVRLGYLSVQDSPSPAHPAPWDASCAQLSSYTRQQQEEAGLGEGGGTNGTVPFQGSPSMDISEDLSPILDKAFSA